MLMSHLMYNPSNEVRHTLASLATLETPPARGTHHHPYSFHDYASTVIEAIPQAGLIVQDAEFAVSNNGDRMFGLVQLKTERDDLTWNIGLRGSHDQRISRGLVAGESIMVCSNLMFSGSIALRTKQTTNIEKRIGGLVIDAVQQMPHYFEEEETMIDRLKDTVIRDAWANAALVEVYKNGGLSSSQLGTAIDEWNEPSFDHGADLNAWRLEQACTQALKPTGNNVNMGLVADRSRVARETIVDLFKLAA